MPNFVVANFLRVKFTRQDGAPLKGGLMEIDLFDEAADPTPAPSPGPPPTPPEPKPKGWQVPLAPPPQASKALADYRPTTLAELPLGPRASG
ncbi:hypothetical protein AB4305_28900 [Nocardia sp. 2YAB30]|uniref:hypothetical protein n=1 Tax=Nocardia sp. 2YAB30 TaxID=3233022 RepID=UPI003F97866E